MDAAPTLNDLRQTLRERVDRQRLSMQLQLKTITPIYGGGTEAGQVDSLVPFRPRAIRNALRHWWWILYRWDPEYQGANGDKKLFQDMAAIWGCASVEGESIGRSRVQIRIELLTKPETIKQDHGVEYAAWRVRSADGRVRLSPDSEAPWSYALFGARGASSGYVSGEWRLKGFAPSGTTLEKYCKSNVAQEILKSAWVSLFKTGEDGLLQRPSPLLTPGIGWRLDLREAGDQPLGEQQRQQVMTALAYWLCYGGVGARTSRGLGRSSVTVGPSNFEPWAWIRDPANNPAGIGLSYPGLGIDDTSGSNPELAMLWLLNKYRDFRQQRNRTGKNPGRSLWPKADLVRMLRRPNGMQESQAPGRLLVPELLFGAPIVLDYGHDAKTRGDPTEKTELTFRLGNLGENTEVEVERYASPCLFGLQPRELPGGVRWTPRLLVLNWRKDMDRFRPAVVARGKGLAVPKSIAYGDWWPGFVAGEEPDGRANREVSAMSKLASLSPGKERSPLAVFGQKIQKQTP